VSQPSRPEVGTTPTPSVHPRSIDGASLLSLIFGAGAVVSGLSPIFGIANTFLAIIPVSVLGIIFSRLGSGNARDRGQSRRPAAVGLALSLLGPLPTAAVLLLRCTLWPCGDPIRPTFRIENRTDETVRIYTVLEGGTEKRFGIVPKVPPLSSRVTTGCVTVPLLARTSEGDLVVRRAPPGECISSQWIIEPESPSLRAK
jgi:hypothetical protein